MSGLHDRLATANQQDRQVCTQLHVCLYCVSGWHRYAGLDLVLNNQHMTSCSYKKVMYSRVIVCNISSSSAWVSKYCSCGYSVFSNTSKCDINVRV